MSDQQLVKVEPQQNQMVESDSEAKVFVNNFDLAGMSMTVGTLKVTDPEKNALFAPVRDEEIDVRGYDGIVYVPHIFITKRWTQAFGTEWGLLPQGMPVNNGEQVMWGFHLIVRGKYLGFAIGGCNYKASNQKMTYDDACEGAKSNAIMRLAKGIGMYSELWDAKFREPWVKEHVETYQNNGKTTYRLKPVEQIAIASYSDIAELLTRFMQTKDCTLEQAFIGLDILWQKRFKRQFMDARQAEVEAILKPLREHDKIEAQVAKQKAEAEANEKGATEDPYKPVPEREGEETEQQVPLGS